MEIITISGHNALLSIFTLHSIIRSYVSVVTSLFLIIPFGSWFHEFSGNGILKFSETEAPVFIAN